jgi:flagellar hook-length control protein FliK
LITHQYDNEIGNIDIMQNSLLFITKATPALDSAKPTKANLPKEENTSFKQVLSKQVEQSGNKATSDKNNGAKANEKNEASKVASPDEQTSKKASVQDVSSDAIEQETDNEVVLDKKEDLSHNKLINFADIEQLSVANITPTVQNMPLQENSQRLSIGSDSKLVVKEEKTVLDKDVAGLSNLETPENEKGLKTLGLGRQLTEDGKFEQSLAAVKENQATQYSSISQSLSELNEATSISTLSMQAVTKSAQFTPAVEQVGFSNLINTSPGRAGWNEAISQKIVWMVGANEQSATLTLNPKDLGPLQVIIHVNNEKADATFISENPEVRKALEEGMSGLRQAMNQSGVELGQANVNTGKQHQAFEQENQQNTSRQQANGNISTETIAVNQTEIRSRVSNGLVDTFA